MLKRAPILIVEDEPFIALELQTCVEDAGGTVVGPVGSVSAALALLGTCVIAAAILDIQLSDRDVTPVADALSERGIPMVFQSGVALPVNLKERLPGVIVYKKPISTEQLVGALVELTQQ